MTLKITELQILRKCTLPPLYEIQFRIASENPDEIVYFQCCNFLRCIFVHEIKGKSANDVRKRHVNILTRKQFKTVYKILKKMIFYQYVPIVSTKWKLQNFKTLDVSQRLILKLNLIEHTLTFSFSISPVFIV